MTESQIDQIADRLRHSIDGEVRFDRAARALYSTDASNYRRVPTGVIIPRHEQDVIRAISVAREHQIPVVARGGGTALAGQTTTTGVVIDFSRDMNRILSIDAERGLATVEPGVVQSHLNAEASHYGLFFAPDPATKDRCTIGGMIGNNSCGAHSAAYGKTVDNVIGLEFLLYDGTRLVLGENSASSNSPELDAKLHKIVDLYGELIRTRFPKIPRRVSGYNLDQLLPENGFNRARAVVGSEGTLGTLLRATVKLVPKPPHTILLVLGFAEVFAAADQVPWILDYKPQALEGFDERLPEYARSKGNEAVKLLPEGRSFLLIEIGGSAPDALRDEAEMIAARARGIADCRGVALLSDPAEQRAVWGIRESGLGAGALIAGLPRTWPGAEDCAVPPVRLGEFMRQMDATLKRNRLVAGTYYGHFGEGCLHCRISFDFHTAQGVAEFRRVMSDLADLVARFGGSISGEHGDGIARSELLPKIFGAELLGAFREFKRIFDPDFRMNPGVIVDPEPIDSNLRIPADAAVAKIDTHFDFSRDGGLAGAMLRCVGIGKCRKTDAGTMCPSYMATRDEMHSTRGRAHLLYEALTGDLLRQGFADRALHEALELCLSCKACKTECPAAVDMAVYKAEFMRHYYSIHRRPFEVQFFGRIHDWARVGALVPKLANLFTSGVLEGTARKVLGIHSDRRLPRLGKRTFRGWFARRSASALTGSEVLLFPDTFNNFFEPQVLIAATEVLERLGFRVTIPARDFCCARPMYEAGMLDAARIRLSQLITTLAEYAGRDVPIIGVEPSCLLTLRDELISMFPHDTNAQAIANKAMLLDEFLAAQQSVLPALNGSAIVHGHCHQKALIGMNAQVSLLGRSPELQLDLPDTGCCGMAGSFGYGIDRFEISRTIAERALLPAIRASAPETMIIANGFACRSQIRQFCPDRNPLHLAEVLARTMTERDARGGAQR